MPEVSPSKYLVLATWDDVPHIDARAKAELLASTPVHLRDARSKGIPTLGSGAVFPVLEEDLVIAPFPVPDHWVWIAGMDFGWDHPFAVALLAWDRDTDTLYLVREFRQSQMTPVRAREALKGWESWLPYAWPHDGLQHEKGSGVTLAAQYGAVGFDMLHHHASFPEDQGGGFSFEAGIAEMLDRMETGRWKVFRSCALWLEEFRLYHREDGRVVKVVDDLLSASRIAMMMRRYARRRPSLRAGGLRIHVDPRTG